MGKKKIIDAGAKEETVKTASVAATPKSSSKASSKKRVETGVLNVESTYNNTKLVLTDTKGNTLAWSTSGALGFKGAKKGTPFAAAKIGETLGDKATQFGVKEVLVKVRGVGSGRESAIRGFISKGINLLTITDTTPVPHNGPKPPKPRRA
ncbi:MAG: 30S ribosomal protein S11 [Minisyncoccota bacterium]